MATRGTLSLIAINVQRSLLYGSVRGIDLGNYRIITTGQPVPFISVCVPYNVRSIVFHLIIWSCSS